MRIRTCKLTLTITEDNEARNYKMRPVPGKNINTVMAFELTNGDKTYEVTLAADGWSGCSCMGFDSSKHCKHVDALKALGIFNAEVWLTMRKWYLELTVEREALENDKRRFREVAEFVKDTGLDCRSCYGRTPEPPPLQADPPPKPKRQRKTKAT